MKMKSWWKAYERTEIEVNKNNQPLIFEENDNTDLARKMGLQYAVAQEIMTYLQEDCLTTPIYMQHWNASHLPSIV
jgi:hypothetical protein